MIKFYYIAASKVSYLLIHLANEICNKTARTKLEEN